IKIFNDQNGQLLNLEHFSDILDFKSGEASAFFDSLSAKAQNTFNGLGTAFASIFKLDPELFDELSNILAQNLLGDIDNARLFVQQLGLSFDELKTALVEAAKQGSISWREFKNELAGLKEAFKPGLEGVGAVKKAFDNLVNSGARGFVAIKSVRDIAIEAAEKGATSLDELADALLNAGVSAEQVEIFMQALNKSGITSLDQLINASDELAGVLVGTLDEMNFHFNEVDKTVDEVQQALTKLNDFKLKPKDLEIRTRITGPGAKELEAQGAALGGVFKGVKAFAQGGIIASPTLFRHSSGLGLAGEAGPEAILPLARNAQGQLGVISNGGGMVVNIDARGAELGVEKRIEMKMRELLADRTFNPGHTTI
ncbi:hypothetical protein D6827_02245, partial [Candidatus Parcubacteria bacterium]